MDHPLRLPLVPRSAAGRAARWRSRARSAAQARNRLGSLPGAFLVGDDAALADRVAAELELGLDERHHLRAGGRQAQTPGSTSTQRDEGEVEGDQRGRRARERLEQPQVGAVEDHHPRVAGQARVELAPAHVDRVHLSRAAGEEHVGEAAGGGPGVERHPSRRVHPEGVETTGELHPGSAGEGMVPAEHPQRAGLPHLLGRARRPGAVDLDQTGGDQALGPLPGGGEPALHQTQVEAAAGRRAAGHGRQRLFHRFVVRRRLEGDLVGVHRRARLPPAGRLEGQTARDAARPLRSRWLGTSLRGGLRARPPAGDAAAGGRRGIGSKGCSRSPPAPTTTWVTFCSVRSSSRSQCWASRVPRS